MKEPKESSADQTTRIEIKGDRSVAVEGEARGLTIITGDGNVIGAQSTAPLPRDKISIARLPTSGPDLFGRDAELQRLDEAWANTNTNIISFIAWGGVGKTALVNHWLKQRVELAVLRLLGLFDRPADAGSIAALRAAPAIWGADRSVAEFETARMATGFGQAAADQAARGIA